MNPKSFEADEEVSDQKMVSLSQDDLRALEHIPNSVKSVDKVRYDKPVNLVIERVSVSKVSKPESEDGDNYISYRVNLHYSDGVKEGLGGFRAYLDSSGKPDRFWSTEKSAGGKLKKMLEGFLELKEPMSFYQFVSNLGGMKVRVRSEDWAVNGKRGYKSLVMEFLEVAPKT